MIIDKELKQMNQEEAYSFYEGQGKRMLNCNDLEVAVKDKDLLKKIQKEMNDGWLLAGDRITYHKNSLKATINPHKGTPITLKIPVYNDWTEIRKVIKTKDGKKYVQALLGKNFKKVLDTLNKDNKTIKFWTPDQESRNERPVRAVRLYFGRDGFSVYGDCWLDVDGGFSRGVLSDSEAKPKSKIKITKKELNVLAQTKKIMKKYGEEIILERIK